MNWTHKPLDHRPTHERASLVRLPAGCRWTVLTTATRFACRHQHWVDQRTLPCLLPENPCPYCQRGTSKWFAAFLGVWNISRQCPQVLALPEDAYKDVAALVGDALEGGLRGWRFEFCRPGDSKRGKITVQLAGREDDESRIPPRLHVPHILYRCWGLPRETYKAAAAAAVAL